MTTQEIPFYTKNSDMDPGGTPLRKFKGLFIGSDEPDKPRRIFPVQLEGRRTQTVNLNFLEVEVLVSLIPYNYPTAQIQVGYNAKTQSGHPSKRSAWAMLTQSSEDLGHDDLSDHLDTFIIMECDPSYKYGQDDDGQDITGAVWRVVELDGTGPGAAMSDEERHAHILTLIDGKDPTSFAEAMIEDGVGKSFEKELFDGSLVASLIASGDVEEVQGVYKVKS